LQASKSARQFLFRKKLVHQFQLKTMARYTFFFFLGLLLSSVTLGSDTIRSRGASAEDVVPEGRLQGKNGRPAEMERHLSKKGRKSERDRDLSKKGRKSERDRDLAKKGREKGGVR
jgi:hypothetical protein